MKKIFHTLLLIGLVTSNMSFSQFHEEKCIYGNCKNGFGILAIKGNKYSESPTPFHVNNILINDPETYYYYYQVGQFDKKKLNGKGYKMRISGQFNEHGSHAWLINSVKQNLLDSIVDSCVWYEKGTYSGGLLNGKGFQIMKDVFMTEANFKNGKTDGASYLIRMSRNGAFKIEKDIETKKIKIINGRQLYGVLVDNFCLDCQEIEYLYKMQGTTLARRMNLDFLNGWVIKDYERNLKTGLMENVKPFRALYVGDMELFKINSVEQSVNSKEVILSNGAKYMGEVDENGKPFGYGIMQLYDSHSKWIYEGFVDNEKPEGWGIIRLEDNDYEEINTILGGFFENGIIRKGAILKQNSVNEKTLISFQGVNDKSKLIYNEKFYDIANGFYTKKIYNYNEKSKSWNLKREESGEKINGYEKNVWVNIGKTNEETKKQRNVSNGFVDAKDLIIGDVVVLNGKASPVVSISGSIYYLLKNKKTITLQSGLKVQLSKHNSAEFTHSCNKCKGSGMEKYTYQRPPTEKVLTTTRYETEVLEFSSWRKTITETQTYIQTYQTEQRSRVCTDCNGKGFTQDIEEIVE